MEHNDTFDHAGHKFRIEFHADSDAAPPWKNEDGHGPVSDWKRHAFGMGSKPPKAPGEMILVWDYGSFRTYDFSEAVKIAKRDGWNAAPYRDDETAGERAHKAALSDFKRLRDWCNGRWSYVGIEVFLLDDFGDDMSESESLWGVESDGYAYHEEVARELAEELLHRIGSSLAA